MIFLIRRLGERWRSATRARVLYIVTACAFAGLAAVAALNGDAAVSAIAGVVALVTVGLAAFVPRIGAMTAPPEKE